ncbi:hypothetical protein [Streptomyces sp. XH2]|uniref:hypothetical protein n=1 Tax=Streptomyces sp. XH2 TaxID=3412483 RepID=UPI003C7E3DBF
MDVTALAHAGSRLQHADQLLAPVCERQAAGRGDGEAVTPLSGLQELIMQARDDALVAYGLAAVTSAPKARAQARALDAYQAIADLADGLDNAFDELKPTGTDASVLARTCQALSQAATFLAQAAGDEHLVAGADGRTPVRLATQLAVHSEAALYPRAHRPGPSLPSDVTDLSSVT